MKNVRFFRDLRQFAGGHLKVWDYFNHVRSTPDFAAQISFSEQTIWTEENPWQPLRDELLRAPENTVAPDLLFLAGLDWERLPADQRASSPVPVLNLIQHVRHADPAHPLFAFLPHRAIRLCVSEEVRLALAATGLVNGPLFTIPNGTDVAIATANDRPIDLLIVGLKQPGEARELQSALSSPGRNIIALTAREPRAPFLHHLQKSRIAVFLPNRTEGFYLPALEAMASGALVVCPDVIGNRSFCTPGVNCYRPAYRAEAILEAARHALQLAPTHAAALVQRAYETAAAHSLKEERRRFLEILRTAETLWNSAS